MQEFQGEVAAARNLLRGGEIKNLLLFIFIVHIIWNC
ncbi:MAG: hypothetical protein PWP05_875 [Thermovirga sp.]|jgi:hypothetical protein|nr:hypothetical protein [Thermovirga sp.]MDN5368160.1 hypothetical protein [Thermovirga sp.]